MKYPYKKLRLPRELKTQINGRLDADLLVKISIGGRMWKGAALAFNALTEKAVEDGIKLRNIGDYRSYESQLRMFKERYAKFNKKTWFLKKGMSPSAAPDPTGKKGSNHGWGLAIDLVVTDKKVADWLCLNAPAYGFFLQGSNPKSPEFELWHWQYCVGNRTPKALKV